LREERKLRVSENKVLRRIYIYTHIYIYIVVWSIKMFKNVNRVTVVLVLFKVCHLITRLPAD